MQSLKPFELIEGLENSLGYKFTEKGSKTSAYVIILAGQKNRSANEKYECKIIFSAIPVFVCCPYGAKQQCYISAKTFDKLY